MNLIQQKQESLRNSLFFAISFEKLAAEAKKSILFNNHQIENRSQGLTLILFDRQLKIEVILSDEGLIVIRSWFIQLLKTTVLGVDQILGEDIIRLILI